MTTSNSGGGDAPANDGSGDAFSGASPYGTRSRNRTGNPRPNYAEDKDMDFEFDYPSKVDSDPRKAARQNQASATTGPDAHRATGSSRRSTLDENKIAASHLGAKDENSSSQMASAHAGNGSGVSQPGTKKRKAAAHSGSSTPAAPSSQAGAPPTSRSASQSRNRNSAGAPSDTNMLSFSDSNAMPKDGKLVADDGTVLAPNGTLRIISAAARPPLFTLSTQPSLATYADGRHGRPRLPRL